MTQHIAGYAESDDAASLLEAMRPLADPSARREANRVLAEALRREREPGSWCHVGQGASAAALAEDPERDADRRGNERGQRLVSVLDWLRAAEATRRAWSEPELTLRYPVLATRSASLPRLDALRQRLEVSLEPDGRVSDAASPGLRRARAELSTGERGLEQRLERWARDFGENAYVTRLADRFVALVPAAGFSRRRGIVHDVSGSGQSLFVEPIEACEANNRLIELRAAVDAEERRVLDALAEIVATSRPELETLARILIELDALRARARWAAEHGGVAIEPQGDRLSLKSARHPVLATGRHRDQVVPLDLDLEPQGNLLLVSGPNMGGKTVLLKTVGLAVVSSHAGLPVLAAEGSAIPEIDQVYTDLGDEQSLDDGLSTFAAHLRSLATMASAAGPRTLLLCDELGAGTDPEEGAALGRALIEHFAARGAWAVITTHLGSLKLLAGTVPGVVNGSLEFDTVSMTPRYRFLAGVPGVSHALTLAERIGLEPSVVSRAKAITPDEARALERLLEDLHGLRQRMDDEREHLAKSRAEAEAEAATSRAVAEDARRAVAELRRKLTRESDVLLSRARELWQTVQREARRSDKTRAQATELKQRLEEVERETESLGASADAAERGFGGASVEPGRGVPAAPIELIPGTRVRVRDLGVEAEVVSVPDAEGKVLLRRGNWSIHTHVDRLGPATDSRDSEGARPARASASWSVRDDAPAFEVDLRGQEPDEAIRNLDEGLDRALVNGLTELRIIHGVGRGVLRAAVERHLRAHPQVAAQRLGQLGEGGRGVTVATLR